MPTATMTRPTLAAVPRPSRDATPREIIEAARTAPATAVAATLVASLTSLLMWASFTPLDGGPLAWLCLVPLCCLVRIERPTRAMFRAAYLAGLVFWVPTLQWMRLGDPTMYVAWWVLSIYLAAYFPLFVGLARVAVHRLRIPLLAAVPVVWTGLELVRAYVFTGFSWYYLGHSQYRWLEMIQISDVTGAYGVSFVLALVAGCLTTAIPQSWLARVGLLPPVSTDKVSSDPPRLFVPAIVTTAVMAATLGYGYWRRSHANFEPGPRVAAIQGNFPASVRVSQRDVGQMYLRHEGLTGQAVAKRPDVIVWPEGMFPYPLLKTEGGTDADLTKVHPNLGIDPLRKLDVPRHLVNISQMAGAAVVFGLTSLDVDTEEYRLYNSAQVVTPQGMGGRYDKIHRVIFGEYIPLADYLPFLQAFTPYRGNFGIEAGKAGMVFTHRGVRFAPVICFEDTVPQLVRNIAAGPVDANGRRQRVDVLLNLTNDGWFHGSSEHDQHLITAAFRCVELRTPMVRAVNTGISALIDGDGCIRARARDDKGRSKQTEAVLVEDVPLDRRVSLYVHLGDWFAGSCLAGCCVFGVFGVMGWWTGRRAATTEATPPRFAGDVPAGPAVT